MAAPAIQTSWLDDLFAAIDAKDADAFVGFLTDDAVFRFGSAPEVSGAVAIRDAVSRFFESIAGCQHTVDNIWTATATIACNGNVRYVRHDNSEITLPFADVFDMRDDRISAYRIYMDIGPLYAA